MAQRLGVAVLWLALTPIWPLDAGGSVAKQSDEPLVGTLKLLWPVHFSSLPLSTPGRSSLEDPQFGEELKAIGIAGFRKYLSDILPMELKRDTKFAADFNISDHSRVNLAFKRWQVSCFAKKHGVVAKDYFNANSALSPPRQEDLSGDEYSWPELHEQPAYRRLLGHVKQHAKLYLARSGMPKSEIPNKFRILTWAEIYGKGEALRPLANTDGAYLMGRYWASVKRDALKLNFEDPRGINPPFGKTHSRGVYKGELVLYPTWISHFITPNMLDDPAVCFVFLVYPESKKISQDAGGDYAAQMTVTKNFKLNRPR